MPRSCFAFIIASSIECAGKAQSSQGVTLNITVDGATFSRTDSGGKLAKSDSTLSSAIGQNGMERGSVVNFTVKSGTFAGSIFAVPRMNPYTSAGVPTVAGTINVSLDGGKYKGESIQYLQTFEGNGKEKYKQPTVTGEFNLSINARDFVGNANKTLNAEGCAKATLTKGAQFPESLFVIKGF